MESCYGEWKTYRLSMKITYKLTEQLKTTLSLKKHLSYTDTKSTKLI
ncbi:hypothetical protein QFZ37_003183 [Chryseobacterium ginsenosidimutans]|nr:hypothetical protein [Chryseobacterium ginsenosidimutans]